MKVLSIVTTFLLVCVVATGHAEAEENHQADSFFSPVSIRVTGNAVSDADFKSSGGSAQVTSGQLRLRAGGISFGYTRAKYSWKDVSRLNFGNGNDDPWDTLHRLRLGYEHEGEISDDWFYSVELVGTSSFEKEMSGSFGGALRGGVSYVINDNWLTYFGARVFTNEINTSVMPYFGVHYSDYDKDGSGFFMGVGAPSTEAGYAFSDEATLRFAFNLEGTTYRLKDESSVVRKGYLETSSMKTGMYFDWRPTDSLSLSLGPEYHFEREMKLYNSNGDKTGPTIKQKSALGGTAQIGYSF